GAVPNHFLKPRIPHDGLDSSTMIFPKDSLYQLDDFHHTEEKADMHQ
ncbi:MAG: hypothetical protein RIQ74_966, partial [Pseudomonadota bacterium]